MKKFYTLLLSLFATSAIFAQCTDLYFSEYSEGSGNNKYLEIYNPTTSAIDLSGYSLFLINNGGSPNNVAYQLSGSIPAQGIYVVANNAADSIVLSYADTALGYNSPVHFNGDDAVCLIKGTDTIDVIGERWVDPGSEWTVGTGSTKEYTLVRKSSVTGGELDWLVGATEWDVLPQNDWSMLGSHTSACTYVVADIADLKMPDADLAPSNLGSRYEITGVVYGIDFDGNAGISFTVIDGSGGINIFNFVDVSDYVVTEGDNITVRGEIAFYRGLLELFADEITLNSQGNELKAPTMVDVVSEATESDYIELRKVWVADGTTTWPSNGNVWLTNDDQDTFQIRIDADATEIAGTDVLYDTMTIIGIGGQFDATAPYDAGYQIFAYKLAHIQEYVAPNRVTFKVDMSRYGNDGGTWNTVNLNGTFNGWCGTCIEMLDADNDKVFEVTVEMPDGEIEWKFTLNGWDMQEEFAGGEPCTKTSGGFTNRTTSISSDTEIPVVCYNKCITCAEAIATVNETEINAISVYPNPSNSVLNIESNENWISYEVYNVLGVKVKDGVLNNNSLSVADMATGTYYIKLTSDNKTGEARFVVSR